MSDFLFFVATASQVHRLLAQEYKGILFLARLGHHANPCVCNVF